MQKYELKYFQPSKSFTIEINQQEIKNIKRVDSWFKIVFNIELKKKKSDNSIHTLSHRSLYLIRKLLQICKIANFYLGSIESIETKPNKYIITIKIPYIDFTPTEFYISILNSSFSFLYLMMDNEPTIENQDFFIQKYLKNLISPILKNNPQGKSQFEILNKAYKKNIPFRHLGNGIFQLGFGANSKKLDRSTTTDDSAIGRKLSSNKYTTSNILRIAGLPCATHGIATKFQDALELAKLLKYPIVVKPLNLGRGEGVSVNIKNEEKLKIAFEYAYNLSPNRKVLIEKQVKGICHRIFIANGKFLYAVKRLPIGIFGNGNDSIEQIIDKTNQKEQSKFFWEKKDIYFKDDIAIKIIENEGFTLNSIPRKGVFIPLREIETTQWGGVDEDVTKKIHHSNIEIALKASKLIGLSTAGVDIITEDITKPWYETNAIINEINYAPLLGGGEISKSYIDKYLEIILTNNGNIPIEVFIKDNQDAIQKGKKRQKEYISSGVKCYFVSPDEILDSNCNTLFMKNLSFIEKCEALFLDKSVETLMIVDYEKSFYKKYY